jgi:hypothetical protein
MVVSHRDERGPMTDLPSVGAPATRALNAAGYDSLESLAAADERDLLELHGFGPRAVRISTRPWPRRGWHRS